MTGPDLQYQLGWLGAWGVLAVARNLGKATALFNVRFNDRWTPETLVAAINEVIANADSAGCTVTLTQAGRAAHAFLCPRGEGVDLLVDSSGGGTSDARFVAAYCPVVECGLPGPSMHKANEHVAVADVEALATLYAAFLRAYL